MKTRNKGLLFGFLLSLIMPVVFLTILLTRASGKSKIENYQIILFVLIISAFILCGCIIGYIIGVATEKKIKRRKNAEYQKMSDKEKKEFDIRTEEIYLLNFNYSKIYGKFLRCFFLGIAFGTLFCSIAYSIAMIIEYYSVFSMNSFSLFNSYNYLSSLTNSSDSTKASFELINSGILCKVLLYVGLPTLIIFCIIGFLEAMYERGIWIKYKYNNEYRAERKSEYTNAVILKKEARKIMGETNSVLIWANSFDYKTEYYSPDLLLNGISVFSDILISNTNMLSDIEQIDNL